MRERGGDQLPVRALGHLPDARVGRVSRTLDGISTSFLPMSPFKPLVAWMTRKTTTLIAISVMVTIGVSDPPTRPPNAVRATRVPACPSRTQSGHWKPTDACRMQSGQIGRSQRWHEM